MSASPTSRAGVQKYTPIVRSVSLGAILTHDYDPGKSGRTSTTFVPSSTIGV